MIAENDILVFVPELPLYDIYECSLKSLKTNLLNYIDYENISI